MTLATAVTLFRLILVPVFAWLAIEYGKTVEQGNPHEELRWLAVITYIIAAASDGIDGWVARRYDQKSLTGAILDPLTDKALLLTGIITLSLVEWGQDWHLPLWFVILVILRDIEILGGIIILYSINGKVPIRPHWTGKVCTITQMIALGWVMLKLFDISPVYPTIIATIFTGWSGYAYYMMGYRQLPKNAARA